ncbi:MAG TPA: hydroxyisourate hydrolase [Egibacteraceae bacterium]
MSLSTHVLDTSRGRPAAGMRVVCERRVDGGWQRLAEHVTDDDGRIADLVGPGALHGGVHRLLFATGDWAVERGERCFWPEVVVVFEVSDPGEHHHVPLLYSPFGYSTYRGS